MHYLHYQMPVTEVLDLINLVRKKCKEYYDGVGFRFHGKGRKGGDPVPCNSPETLAPRSAAGMPTGADGVPVVGV